MVGTLAYMAPERLDPETDHLVGPPADVFAWGGVVAYAGTCRTPFGGDSPPVTAGRILTGEPDLDGLSGTLRDLVASALAKDPADRPTARELLDLLVSGPHRPAATAAALDHQPGLRAAAHEAQAVPAGLIGYAEDAITTVPVSEMTRAAMPGQPPPVPARRWFLPVAVAGFVLAVVAAAVMLVVAPMVRRTGATPTTPVLTDDLTESRLWLPTAEPDGRSRCDFEGALTVRVLQRGLYKCRGPQDQLPRDLAAEVNVRLLTPGACAALWFRFTQMRGYQLQVCPASLYVGTHKGNAVQVFRTLPLDRPIPVGGAAVRIGLRASGDTLEVTCDGATVGTAPLTDAEITGNRLLLGVYTDRAAPATGEFAVAFDHIEVRGLPDR